MAIDKKNEKYDKILNTIDYKMSERYHYKHRKLISFYKQCKRIFDYLGRKGDVTINEYLKDKYQLDTLDTLIELDCIAKNPNNKYWFTDNGLYISNSKMFDELIKRNRKRLWKDIVGTVEILAIPVIFIALIIYGLTTGDISTSSSSHFYDDDINYCEQCEEYEAKMDDAQSYIDECRQEIQDAIDTEDFGYLEDALNSLDYIDLSH